MNILIAGGSGFIGKSLSNILSANHDLTLLSRSSNLVNSAYKSVLIWENLNENVISQFDIIINLCGYNISDSRWSNRIRKKIIDSRTKTTHKLVELIGSKNIWLINASAIGFYSFSSKKQDERNFLKTEPSNWSFCQHITNQWESVVSLSNVRKWTILRFGVVLDNGGMLAKLIPSAKIGLGAVIGDGTQLISWVSLNDLCRAICFIIDKRIHSKAINIVSPHPSTQRELIESLCVSLNRPRLFKIPKRIVLMLFGQMGKELLLGSHNIYPTLLSDYGFQFNDTSIKSCIDKIITGATQ